MQKNIASESLDLAETILSDLELSIIPLHNAYMKASRLARLLSDADQLSIFQYELSGYPSTPNGVNPDIWNLCRNAGRIYEEKTDKGEVKEFAYTDSIEQLENSIETLKSRLDFGRPQPISISSANPNQYVVPPGRNIQLEGNLATSLRKTIGQVSSRRQYIYRYCLDRAMELRVSTASEQIFEDYRKFVDGRISEVIPSELVKMESITTNLSSDNSEDWANALHSCRRLLHGLADKLYPPRVGENVERSGKNIGIGPEQYINRLVLYCEDNSSSDVYIKVVGSSLKFLGDRLDAAFDSVQKGSHSEVTLLEARRYVINTYLLIGDILMLNEQNKGNDILSSAQYISSEQVDTEKVSES